MELNIYECPYLHDVVDKYCNLSQVYQNCQHKECEVLNLIQENKLLREKIELMKCRQNCLHGFEEKCKHRRCDPCSEWELKEEQMSFHEKRMSHIKSACLFAYDQARKEDGDQFSSMHEAKSILRAEEEELLDEIKDIKLSVGDVCGYINNEEAIKQNLELVQSDSINAMMALAQIWAVCEKMKKGVDK